MPMVFAARDQAWRLAGITTAMSVVGGCFGYLIGAYFFDLWGDDILDYFQAHETFAEVQASYLEHGMIIILLAGFTPVPYKIFTIASGVVGVALLPFVLMSLIGRGGRFFLVSGLIKLGGEKLEKLVTERIEILGWVSLIVMVLGYGIYKISTGS